MASPPESETPPPPLSDRDSSPPPHPSNNDSSSPPPPSEDSSHPPSDSSPPPSDSSPPPPSPPPPEKSLSPPPPSESSDSPPPPESSSDSSPPPPKSSSSSSSSPPKSGSSNDSPPPPPRSALAPPKSSSHSSSSPDSNSTSPSKNDSSSDNLPIIIGVVVGAGLLLLVMILLCLCCKRKKKKRVPSPGYYVEPHHSSKGDKYYYSSQHQQQANWHGSPSKHVVKLPTPPGMHQSPAGMPSGIATSQHMGWGPPPVPYASSGEMSSGGFSSSHGPPRPPPHPSMALGFTQNNFSYEELASATGGFSQNHILGQGGFGYVFKGVLPNGKEIAVKCLKAGSGQGDREFQAEVEIISRVHHRHLVSLVGYCMAGEQRILVYEFVPNKTLEFHLHGKDTPTMDWATRLKIALGSAKGLAYLHEDCHPRIIHRDIKAANILLDHNFDAKVADFGLAKLSSDNYTHVSTRVMGTFGYLAPEYAASGKLTEKSDTFSFGVMLLELITGRRPVDITGELMEDSLVDWARPLIDSALQSGNFKELVDPLLEGNFDPQEMACMVACAGACTRHSAKRRPKMTQVARALEGDASLDDLNSWNKQTQSAVFGDSNSSGTDFEGGTYSSDMKKFRKTTFNSQEYASSEYGATSEYGLNPSTSSSSSLDSQEINSHKNRTRAA